MGIPLVQVDAFTDRPFAGNPAAVCLLDAPADAVWMQAVAAEMNLSETAFLHPEGDGFGLRWFTPTLEVDLCGHATLAAAHVLWQRRLLAADDTARFQTRSGLLTARRQGDWIELDFPATPAQPVEAPPALRQALGVQLRYAGRSQFDYLVEVTDEATVRALAPDLALIASLPVRCVIVTSAAALPAYDFVSRVFGPAAGIDEDPVTGSAHCCLGPFWGARLGKTTLIGFQASKRGGSVRVGLAGERVLLGGQAVTVFEGELSRS